MILMRPIKILYGVLFFPIVLGIIILLSPITLVTSIIEFYESIFKDL